MSDTLEIDFTQFGGQRVVLGPDGEVWNFGWAAGLAPEQTTAVLPALEARQGHPALWSDVYQADGSDPDDDVFFWDNERLIRGSVQPSWDQSSIGSCVSFGWGRGTNDLLLYQAAQGEIEPVTEDVATEPIYGGSRVEVGKGVLGSGDGSLGSWAADWMLKWGILLRKQYPGSGDLYDLRQYSVSRCRTYGLRGCPDDLEPEAKLYPIQSVALVTSGEEAWQALGIGKPIPICSNRGFDSPLKDGFCEPRGTWNHCMCVRARFTHASKGRCVVIQNSWGDYLKSRGNPHSIITTKNGKKVQLPDGCFATTLDVLDKILRQRDSYAISGARGFKERNRFRW